MWRVTGSQREVTFRRSTLIHVEGEPDSDETWLFEDGLTDYLTQALDGAETVPAELFVHSAEGNVEAVDWALAWLPEGLAWINGLEDGDELRALILNNSAPGMAIVGRLTPIAFGVIFAMSGAVGPIIGQNAGAGQNDRVRGAYRDGLIFTGVVVVVVEVEG